MLEGRGDANLRQKTLDADRGAELGVEELERDEALMAQVSSQVDGRHSATTNLALELIPADQCAIESREDIHGVHLMIVPDHRLASEADA